MSIKRTVQAPNVIEDGLHSGVIIGVKERIKPFEYLDIQIEFIQKILDKDTIMKIKCGFPDFISPTSKLGLFLTKMGLVLEIGSNIDIETFLVGKGIDFQTITKVGNDGRNYANVVLESIKPNGK